MTSFHAALLGTATKTASLHDLLLKAARFQPPAGSRIKPSTVSGVAGARSRWANAGTATVISKAAPKPSPRLSGKHVALGLGAATGLAAAGYAAGRRRRQQEQPA